MINTLDIERYRGIPYKYESGPGQVKSIKQGHIDGANCIRFAHWALEEIAGVRLPENMLSKEIYEDCELFRDVQPKEEVEPGDVFLFGREGQVDPCRLHLAICTGEKDEKGNPLLAHANYVEKTVSTWPLNKFFEYPRYERLFAVKRFRQPLVRE